MSHHNAYAMAIEPGDQNSRNRRLVGALFGGSVLGVSGALAGAGIAVMGPVGVMLIISGVLLAYSLLMYTAIATVVHQQNPLDALGVVYNAGTKLRRKFRHSPELTLKLSAAEPQPNRCVEHRAWG